MYRFTIGGRDQKTLGSEKINLLPQITHNTMLEVI